MVQFRRSLWMLALLLLALPGSGALPGALLGDAGSGDAGGSPDAAMPLPFGAYQGNLTALDEDWFAFPASGAPCVDVGVASSHAMGIVLARDGEEVLSALTDATGLFATTVALAPGVPQVAARPDELPWSAASAGPYAFSVEPTSTVVALDRLDTSSDAPGWVPVADALTAPCVVGWFHYEGRDVDVATFTGAAGEIATLSLATATGAGSATILDAEGAPLGSVDAGGATQVLLPADGSYALVLEGAPAPDKYAWSAALVVGPPGQGCRPMCIAA